jgi:hypothetical protein
VNLEEHDNDHELNDSMKSAENSDERTEEFDVQPMIQSMTPKQDEDEVIMTKATPKVDKKEDVKIVDNFM